MCFTVAEEIVTLCDDWKDIIRLASAIIESM